MGQGGPCRHPRTVQHPISRILAVVLLCGTTASHGSADDVEPFPTVSALVATLGRPARTEAVVALSARAANGSTEERVRWARALGRSGGVHTWAPLLRLMEDREGRVRGAAMAGLAESGAWGGTPEFRLLGLLDAKDVSDATAAVKALGRVGTAAALPRLFPFVDAAAPELARAARGALERITGMQRGGNASRWEAWWRLAEPRLRDRLLDACDTVAIDADAPAAGRAREEAIALAWVDPDAFARSCDAWLRGWDDTLHRHAALAVKARPVPRLLIAVRKRAKRAREDSTAGRTLREALRAVGMPIE